MNETTYQQYLKIIGIAGSIIADVPIAEMLDLLVYSESVAPFIDPTVYMQFRASASAQAVKPLLEVARAFQTAAKAAQDAVEAS